MGNEIELAFGRILRMASRPSADGDVEEYYRCRAIIMDALAVDSFSPVVHSFASDYGKGAAGQW